MRRIFVIPLLFCLGAMGLRAETDTPNPENSRVLTDSIVVTAQRFGVSPQKSIWPTMALNIERIDGQISLPSALDGCAGIDIREYSGAGSISTLSNWGVFTRQMLLLYDGRPVRDYSLGGFNLSDYSVDEFERIELVKGPQSSFYGADAVGGVVNLLSKTALTDRLEARVKYGSFEHTQGRVDAAQYLENMNLGFGGFVEYMQTDNARDNAGTERLLFGLRTDYLSADNHHRISLSSRYFRDSIGVPGPVPDQVFLPTYGNAEANSLYDHQMDENYSVDFSYRYYEKSFGEARIDAFWEKKSLEYRGLYYSDWYGPEDLYTYTLSNKRSSGVSARVLKESEVVDFAYGVDFLSGSVRATEDDTTFTGGSNDLLYTSYNYWSKSQDQFDVWMSNGLQPLSYLRLDGSARLQFIKDRDTQQSFNLGAVIGLNQHWRFKIGYGYAFRLPTIAEQYADELFVIGNPDLSPETSETISATMSFDVFDNAVAGSGTVFFQTVDSLIQYQYNPVRYRSIPQNVERFKSTGLDIDLQATLLRNLRLDWSGTWQNAEQTTDQGGVYAAAYYVPGLKWRASVDYSPMDRLTVGGNLTFTSDRGIVMYGGMPKTIDKVYELGASVTARVSSQLRVRLTGYDLTDQQRPDQFGFVAGDGDYPTPGRRFLMDLTWSMF